MVRFPLKLWTPRKGQIHPLVIFWIFLVAFFVVAMIVAFTTQTPRAIEFLPVFPYFRPN